MWTQFWDMHSGGSQKEKYANIFIEASDEGEAKIIFYNRFGHNPDRVTCTCCGEDYSIDSHESLEQITGFHRGCKYVKGEYIEEGYGLLTLEEYAKKDDVLIIYASEIKDEERIGKVPEQGYVWL